MKESIKILVEDKIEIRQKDLMKTLKLIKS